MRESEVKQRWDFERGGRVDDIVRPREDRAQSVASRQVIGKAREAIAGQRQRFEPFEPGESTFRQYRQSVALQVSSLAYRKSFTAPLAGNSMRPESDRSNTPGGAEDPPGSEGGSSPPNRAIASGGVNRTTAFVPFSV